MPLVAMAPRDYIPASSPGLVAQLVEQRTFNPLVVGSSPTRPISRRLVSNMLAEWPLLVGGHSSILCASLSR